MSLSAFVPPMVKRKMGILWGYTSSNTLSQSPLEIGTENWQHWILATFSIIFDLSRNLVNLNNPVSSRSRSPGITLKLSQLTHQNQANCHIRLEIEHKV